MVGTRKASGGVVPHVCCRRACPCPRCRLEAAAAWLKVRNGRIYLTMGSREIQVQLCLGSMAFGLGTRFRANGCQSGGAGTRLKEHGVCISGENDSKRVIPSLGVKTGGAACAWVWAMRKQGTHRWACPVLKVVHGRGGVFSTPPGLGGQRHHIQPKGVPHHKPVEAGRRRCCETQRSSGGLTHALDSAGQA